MRTKFKSISLVIGACLALLSTVPAHLRAATLTVTSTADSGAGTLRAALASAANGDTIDASGVIGAILLTSGELLVTNSVIILGPGPANLAVNGNAVSRVFHVALSNTVTIAGLTITNGKTSGGYPTSSGGGIYNYHSTLTVSNCTLSGNSAGYGGGIYNDGYSGSATLVVSTSTLSNNSVSGSGGGIYNDGTSSGNGMLTVSASILSSNSASYGGGVYNDGYSGSATLQVLTSTLSGNSVSNRGGGIYNNSESSGNGTLIVSNSTLRGNSTSGNNGGGGGIYSDGASSGNAKVTVITSTLSSNLAGANNGGGGGIYNDGRFSGGKATLLVSASTLSGNSAIANNGGGGGIYNNGESSGTGTVQIGNSTLSGNSARYGGGIYNDGTSFGKAALLVLASTFSGNSLTGGGNGGAISINGSGGSASLEIGGTILNAGAAGANIGNPSGTVSSDGYNLSSDSGAGFLTGTADQINTDPMLGPLQDNGGPTFTHALLPGSPAIDQSYSFGLTTDQRGFPRTVDRPCIANAAGGDGTDIGAFEWQQPCPVPLPLANVGVVSNQFVFDLAGSSNQVAVVEASTDLVSWTALATNMLGASPLHFSDPATTNFQQRFYRAKLAP